MSDTYTLNYTAEQINHRLDLINENKNLLPYPYEYSITDDNGDVEYSELPEVLVDVGDGSFLTSGTEIGPYTGILWIGPRDFGPRVKLPKGKYIASLDIVNIEDKVVESSDFYLAVVPVDDDFETQIVNNWENNTCIIETVTEADLEVYLQIPETFEKNLLIRPQIEKVQLDEYGNEILEKTNWVPYMSNIGSYVDERFNSTNTKIKVLSDELSDISTTETYTVPVPLEKWESIDLQNTGDGGYLCEIEVPGIRESDNPIVDILLSEDIDANKIYLSTWAEITRIITGDNLITLYADDGAPETAFTMQIKVVR